MAKVDLHLIDATSRPATHPGAAADLEMAARPPIDGKPDEVQDDIPQQGANQIPQQWAKPLGLLLMVASGLLMVGLIIGAWLTIRQLL